MTPGLCAARSQNFAGSGGRMIEGDILRDLPLCVWHLMSPVQRSPYVGIKSNNVRSASGAGHLRKVRTRIRIWAR